MSSTSNGQIYRPFRSIIAFSLAASGDSASGRLQHLGTMYFTIAYYGIKLLKTM